MYLMYFLTLYLIAPALHTHTHTHAQLHYVIHFIVAFYGGFWIVWTKERERTGKQWHLDVKKMQHQDEQKKNEKDEYDTMDRINHQKGAFR